LRSATTGGVDVVDTGLHVDRDIKDIVLRFALSGTMVSGQMTTAGNLGPLCYAVAFSKNPAYWTFGSRRVAAALPDSLGRFELRNLPAGDYWLAAYNGAEPPSWTDAGFLGSIPRQSSLVVNYGAKLSHDLQCR
jgi:hypothetical protein